MRLSAEHGSSDWSAGYNSEKNPFSKAVHSAEWSVFQKAFLFGIILAVIAIYLRVSRQREMRDELLYEKTLASRAN